MALFEESELEDEVCSAAREPNVVDPEEAAAIVETGMANQKKFSIVELKVVHPDPCFIGSTILTQAFKIGWEKQ